MTDLDQRIISDRVENIEVVLTKILDIMEVIATKLDIFAAEINRQKGKGS